MVLALVPFTGKDYLAPHREHRFNRIDRSPLSPFDEQRAKASKTRGSKMLD
jgi:hypothetical protein